MKQIISFFGSLAAVGLAYALQGPTMQFVGLPAVEQGSLVEPELRQMQHGGDLVAIFKQPSACGQRPAKPWFERVGQTVRVGYTLAKPEASSAHAACIATGVFTIKGLRDQSLTVVAQADRAMPQVADETAATAAPSMRFVSAPAIARSDPTQPGLTWHWHNQDQLVVIAQQAARCGGRATAPAYSLEREALRVAFEVPAPDSAQPACSTTAIFSFKGLPNRELKVLADARQKPAEPERAPTAGVLASMKFMSLPAVEERGVAGPERLQFRQGDSLIVILKQPSACGERPANPWYAVKSGAVQVGYTVSTRPENSADRLCTARGIFSFQGLPVDAGTGQIAAARQELE